jgi:thymidylate synthase ThyX
MGMKRRFLMKMDTAEVDYIAELRTRPAGHIAYRRVAWEMFQALKRVAPALAVAIEDRVTDPNEPIDLYNR